MAGLAICPSQSTRTIPVSFTTLPKISRTMTPPAPEISAVDSAGQSEPRRLGICNILAWNLGFVGAAQPRLIKGQTGRDSKPCLSLEEVHPRARRSHVASTLLSELNCPILQVVRHGTDCRPKRVLGGELNPRTIRGSRLSHHSNLNPATSNRVSRLNSAGRAPERSLPSPNRISLRCVSLPISAGILTPQSISIQMQLRYAPPDHYDAITTCSKVHPKASCHFSPSSVRQWICKVRPTLPVRNQLAMV